MPALTFSIFFITGIIIGSQYCFSNSILTILIIITISVISAIYKKNDLRFFALLLTSFLILIAGIYKANMDFFHTEDNHIGLFPDTERVKSIELTGIISGLPDTDPNRIRFILESRKIISGAPANDTFEVTGDIMTEVRKNIFDKSDQPQPELDAGDLVTLCGRIAEVPLKRNPGEFDYRTYLKVNNIHKLFYANGYDKVRVVGRNEAKDFYYLAVLPVKKFVLKTIDKNYSGDEAAFLKGLITGERSDISAEMKESFVNSGVMHLIAVSGLNVAYIILSVTLILSMFRIPVIPRIIITILFLIFYCMFTGGSASIVRASIMGILVLLAFAIERRIIFYNFIGIAAMVILIHDTKQLFDPGFILSFTATVSMVVFLRKFEYLFLDRLKEMNIKGKKISILIAGLFFTSLAAQIGTIPLTANYFGKISIVSLLANIAAVPLSNLSLAIGFLQMIIASFSEHLSFVITEANSFLLHVQLSFIKMCASADLAYISVRPFSYQDFLCYYFILIILLSINEFRKIFFGIILCILLLTGLYIYDLELSKKLRVTFLDVGQGDCSIIQTPDDKVILVDCGRYSFTTNSGERTIAPFLRRSGIGKIDILILTHLHMDHIGGINYLLNNFKIGKILDSGQKYSGEFTNTMDSLIISKNIPREKMRSGKYINDIKDIRIYFLFPDEKFVDKDGNTSGNNLNNGSIAFKLKFREAEFFFSGDIEKEAEEHLTGQYSDFLGSDVLKVAHHGSITSTTIPFIIKNKPKFAIISCGLYNKFRHPSGIILKRLENSGAKIYRTDKEGAIIVETNGYETKQIDWR